MGDSMELGEDVQEERLRQELSCQVCARLYEDPYLLPCSHTFCRECLERSSKEHRRCPLCRTAFAKDQPIPNRALNSACEVFRQQSGWSLGHRRPGDDTCMIHLKPLELFCEKDETPVCVECVKQHNTHTLWPLRDGLMLCKRELNCKVGILEKKRDSYKRTTHKLQSTAEYIKVQAAQAEKQIKAEYERLRQALLSDERRRLEAVSAEEKQKVTDIEELIAKTKEDIKSLEKLIDSVKKEMCNEDLSLLQNFKDFKSKAVWIQTDPCLRDGSLLNLGKHVGSLSFKIWKDMQQHVKYYPVVLDPSTASPWLDLSADLTSIKESPERLTIPDNPERFDPCVFVLGSEGYSSGRHKWDVIVGDNPKWIVGVCKESVVRKKTFTLSTNRGVWSVCLSKGTYSASTAERTELQVQSRPRRIRVKLNVDKGDVSFWDGETEKCLVSFMAKFSEKVFPIFGPGLCSEPMTLVPGKMAVHT